MTNWVTVANTASLKEGDMKAVTVGDVEIAVYCFEGQYYATHNICTHAQAYMTDGILEADEIECPLHGGRFNIKTGKGLCAPITCDLQTYPVQVVGADIQVAR
jgi:naphthalene 1,2-dioxygenase system ferredoxin subunit